MREGAAGDQGAAGSSGAASTSAQWSPPREPHRSYKTGQAMYQDAWEASALETMRQLTITLLCAGGSGALAKTAVAPLERVKVQHASYGQHAHAHAHTMS